MNKARSIRQIEKRRNPKTRDASSDQDQVDPIRLLELFGKLTWDPDFDYKAARIDRSRGSS